MSTPKRHHFLPEFYLKGFTDNLKQFQVYDFKTGDYRLQTPINTGVRSNYYSFLDNTGEKDRSTIEDFFSKIEQPAKKAIEKLDTRQKLSNEDLEWLACFTAFQITRVPHFEQVQNNMEEQLRRAITKKAFSSRPVVKNFLEQMNKDKGRNYDTSAKTVDRIIETVQNDQYEIIFPRSYNIGKTIDTGYKLIVALLSLNWRFFIAPKESIFITSDNPFIIKPPKDRSANIGVGIITPGAVKVIALSCRSCLIMGDFGNKVTYYEIDKATTRKINIDIALRCHRFVIAKDKTLLERIITASKGNRF